MKENGLSTARSILIAIVCSIILLALSGAAIRGVKNHIQPRLAYDQAQNDWLNGQYPRAVLGFAAAYKMGAEAEFRWLIARPQIAQMNHLSESGDLESELAICKRVVQTIGQYDPEGVMSYRCNTIELTLERDRCQRNCDGRCVWLGSDLVCKAE
jgi:hypothetical protein